MAYATKITAGGVTKDIKDAEAIRATSLAQAYSNTSTYEVGDVCTYETDMYQCVVAITAPEGWESSHWEKVVVTEMYRHATQEEIDEAITL